MLRILPGLHGYCFASFLAKQFLFELNDLPKQRKFQSFKSIFSLITLQLQFCDLFVAGSRAADGFIGCMSHRIRCVRQFCLGFLRETLKKQSFSGGTPSSRSSFRICRIMERQHQCSRLNPKI